MEMIHLLPGAQECLPFYNAGWDFLTEICKTVATKRVGFISAGMEKFSE